MRNMIVTATILLFISADSYGQFKKGSVLLGGDVSFNTAKTENFVSADENKSHSFVFSPVFGKAVKDNLFVGGSLGFGGAKSTYNNNGETRSKNYNASLFVRKYKSVFGKFNAFVQAGMGVNRNISESEQGPGYFQRTTGYITSASLTPGISVGVAKKLFLEAGFNNILSLSYNSSKTTGSNFGNTIDSKSSSFGISSSLNTEQAGLFFGVRFILPR